MTKHEHNKKAGHHGDDKKKGHGDHKDKKGGHHEKKSHDHGHEAHSHDHEDKNPEEDNGTNQNLTKKDLKMIEKLKAKIEFHEIRDEYDEAAKLRAQIQAIENKPAHHVKE